MAKGLIGININTVEAEMVKVNGKVYFKQTPDNLVGKDEIVSMELMSQFLKSTKKEGKISGSEVAMVLPEHNTYFRVINSPVMSDEQIKLNLPYEFKNYTGSDSSKYNFDYFVDETVKDENGTVTGLKLVAAATLRSVTEDYAAVFKRAGLSLRLALPQEVCLINVMKKCAKNNKECALIGLGYDYTNVYLFKGADLVASKAIEIGCRDIDNVISSDYGVDAYLAASYRDSNHEDCLNSYNVSKIYERISVEVVKTINFYKYENNESEINTAYFFDLGANNQTLINNICESISFKEGNINNILPEQFKNNKDSARCLTSIGATL